MVIPCSEPSRRLLYDGKIEAERYWCPLVSSAPSVGLLHVQRQLDAVVARGASFYFVGDSVSAQHMRSVACALGVDSIASTSLGPHWLCYTRGQSRWRICHLSGGSMTKQQSKHEVRFVEQPIVVEQGSFLDLTSSQNLAKGDIIIMNEGVHWRHHPQQDRAYDKEMQRIARIAASTAMDRALRAGARVLWRETLSQHFNTSSGLYPRSGASREHVETCSSHDGRTAAAALLNKTDAINEMLTSAHPGVLILPGFASTFSLYNEHFGTCTLQNKSRPLNASAWTAKGAKKMCDRPVGHGQHSGIDCTHWCEQSEVYHQLNAKLAKLLDVSS